MAAMAAMAQVESGRRAEDALIIAGDIADPRRG